MLITPCDKSSDTVVYGIGEEPMYGDQHQYKYMTVDDMKSLGDDSMRMDVTRDEKGEYRNSYGECSSYGPKLHWQYKLKTYSLLKLYIW